MFANVASASFFLSVCFFCWEGLLGWGDGESLFQVP